MSGPVGVRSRAIAPTVALPKLNLRTKLREAVDAQKSQELRKVARAPALEEEERIVREQVSNARLLADEALQRGDWKRCEEALTSALFHSPRDDTLLNFRSTARLKQEKVVLAESDARAAIALSPASPRGYYRLGRALSQQQHRLEAGEAYLSCLERSPYDPVSESRLGEVVADLRRSRPFCEPSPRSKKGRSQERVLSEDHAKLKRTAPARCAKLVLEAAGVNELVVRLPRLPDDGDDEISEVVIELAMVDGGHFYAEPVGEALIAHAHAQGLKVLLAFHWNNSLGDDALFAFYNDPAAMQASASNMCARTREARCDGFSVDFEAPNVRFNATFRGLYAGYIRRVAAVASQLNLSVTTTLFMDLPTNRGIDGSAVAAAATGGTVLMTYDYHYGSSDPVAGPNAPLVGNNGSNVNHTVAWALSHGMPAANTLMGIPWYSREYPTISPAYQAATNVSKTVPDQTAKAYSLPVAQKRALTLGEGGALWDASSLTPWYKFRDPTRPWLWWEGYSDNARSLALKYDVVKAFGLQGVLIWMLNGCTQTEAPWLWSGLDAAFGKAARSP